MAQLPSVSQPAPPIAFGEWREVARSETSAEYVIEFPSSIASRFPNNDVVPLRVILPEPRMGPVPVVLALHFWGATDLRVERSLAEELLLQNVATAIITLPYHLSRTPPGVRSGELAIEPDVERLQATMTQACLDVRRAIDFLQSRSEFRAETIGIAGTSLGALVAALSFSVDERITHASFVVGGADLAGILWNSSKVLTQREELRRRGYSETSLREALVAVEPLTYLAGRKGGTTFVVKARYDTVVPTSAADQLIAALPSPTVMVLDTGHYGGVFVRRRLQREVARFFGLEMRGLGYRAPARLIAPTIRLGLRADYPNGVDIFVGLDLWRLDPRRRSYITGLLTPRGIQVMASYSIGNGLAAGITAGTRNFGIGIAWSIVL